MIFTQLAEHERGAHVGKVQELLRSITQFLEQPFSRLNSENEKAECQLKAQSPSNSFWANGLAIGGKDIGETQDCENAEHTCESSHAFLLCASRSHRAATEKRIRTET